MNKKNLLHEFFNSTSDAAGSLEAAEQERLERAFQLWFEEDFLTKRINFPVVGQIAIEFIQKSGHSHMSIVADSSAAEFVEGVASVHLPFNEEDWLRHYDDIFPVNE